MAEFKDRKDKLARAFDNLERRGIIRRVTLDGKEVYQLTEEGVKFTADLPDDDGDEV